MDMQLLACVIGCGLAVLGIQIILFASARGWIGVRRFDLHHTHREHIPRFAGIVFAGVFLLAVLMADCLLHTQLPVRYPHLLMASIAGICALGLADDLRPLGAKRKLLGQIVAASLAYWSGVQIESITVPWSAVPMPLAGVSYLLTVVWLVGLTNLINLVDGLDGLAGGICLMLMALLVAMGGGSSSMSLATAAVAGALMGFLRYNFPPARIYMGDGGAYFLGFFAGVASILSSQKGTVLAAFISPMMVLAFPILDTSIAILRRGAVGLPIFRPDRAHIHHRLLELGISRRRLVLWVYMITLAFLACGYISFILRGYWTALAVGFVVLIILACEMRLNLREKLFTSRSSLASADTRDLIGYALLSSRWIHASARCGKTLEEPWRAFTFCARALGFSYARLTLSGQDRSWGTPASEVGGQLRWSYAITVPGSPQGRLELARLAGTPASSRDARHQAVRRSQRESHTLSIVSELLAEGWIKACAELSNRAPAARSENDRPSIPAQATRRFPYANGSDKAAAEPMAN